MSDDKLFKFLNKIYMNIIKEFYAWKNTKRDLIYKDDTFAIKCDKTTVKLMSVELNQESLIFKIKSSMFLKMKTDIKSFVEYEFEIE